MMDVAELIYIPTTVSSQSSTRARVFPASAAAAMPNGKRSMISTARLRPPALRLAYGAQA
jgi:hypothetical protein